MKNLLAATLVVSAFAFAPGASAGDFFPGDPEFSVSGDPFNGPVSAHIGRDGLAEGVFTDNFIFRIGTDGLGSGSVTTSLSGVIGSVTDLDFLSVIFNNGTTNFDIPITSSGGIETAGMSNIPIFADVVNTLSIQYQSRGSGSYGGNLTFVANAIPEPMTWSLMQPGPTSPHIFS